MAKSDSEDVARANGRARAAMSKARSLVDEGKVKARTQIAKWKDNAQQIQDMGLGAAAGMAAGHFLGDYTAQKVLEGEPMPMVPYLGISVVRFAGFGAAAVGVMGMLDDDSQNLQLAFVGTGVASADLALASHMKRLAAGLDPADAEDEDDTP